GFAVSLMGLHRGVPGAAQTDSDGRLKVNVEERPDIIPPPAATRELEREYRAVVEEILELRGDDGRLRGFVRSITHPGALADTAGYSPDLNFSQKVELLETVDVAERLNLALRFHQDRLAEFHVSRRIRDAVPWSKRSEERLDPKYAREVLDADHAGLDDVKRRITEYLAVRKLRAERGLVDNRRSGAILTLIGPPGTGKTSIGESIARATGR